MINVLVSLSIAVLWLIKVISLPKL